MTVVSCLGPSPSCLQTIVRGSFLSRGDDLSQLISQLSRLSVTSSNSLRRCSPSARRRAQSLGRLGELAEDQDQAYQYQGLGPPHNTSTYWQDRVLEGGAGLNGALHKAKSICEVRGLREATPPSPDSTGVTGGTGAPYARSEGAGLRQGAGLRHRPSSCYSPHTVDPDKNQSRLKPGPGPSLTLGPGPGPRLLPDLLSTSRETPRRPQSSYTPQVRHLDQVQLRTFIHCSYYYISVMELYHVLSPPPPPPSSLLSLSLSHRWLTARYVEPQTSSGSGSFPSSAQEGKTE